MVLHIRGVRDIEARVAEAMRASSDGGAAITRDEARHIVATVGPDQRAEVRGALERVGGLSRSRAHELLQAALAPRAREVAADLDVITFPARPFVHQGRSLRAATPEVRMRLLNRVDAKTAARLLGQLPMAKRTEVVARFNEARANDILYALPHREVIAMFDASTTTPAQAYRLFRATDFRRHGDILGRISNDAWVRLLAGPRGIERQQLADRIPTARVNEVWRALGQDHVLLASMYRELRTDQLDVIGAIVHSDDLERALLLRTTSGAE
jgi:hypothetical protein